MFVFTLSIRFLMESVMDQENEKKKSVFGGFVSADQKKEMIHFMEEHPDLKSGKFTNKFTYKTAQDLWNELSLLLNSIPGARKEWKQWRKTWQDMKSMVKKKNTLIKNHKMETGGGPPITEIRLSNDDEKIIELIGTAVVEGDPLVLESTCTFDFETDSLVDNNILVDKEIELNSGTLLSEHNYFDIKVLKESKEWSCTEPSTSTSTCQPQTSNGICTPTTSNRKRAPEIFNTPSNSAAKKKRENVSTFGSGQANKKNGSTSDIPQSKETFVRVQRLNKAMEANKDLLNLTANRNRDKLKYSDEKLVLYKRDVEAKESIAKSLDLLVNYFINQNP